MRDGEQRGATDEASEASLASPPAVAQVRGWRPPVLYHSQANKGKEAVFSPVFIIRRPSLGFYPVIS